MDQLIKDLNPAITKEGTVEFSPDGDAEVEVDLDFKVPNCSCGSHYKPDVVFFGEQVPKDRVGQAEQMIMDAGAILVAGSSLTVNSGLRLVKQAISQEKPVVIVNLGPTKADGFVSVKINASASDVLKEIFA